MFTYLLAVVIHSVISDPLGVDTAVDLIPKKKLHVGALIPYIDTHDEYCFHSAMLVATDVINNDDSILKEYELVIHYYDSTTLLGFAMVSYFKLMKLNITMQAIIGPAFSYSTRVVALFTTKEKIPQVSYAALSQLSDGKNVNIGEAENEKNKKFPYFVRTTPSLESYRRAHALLLQAFKWSRVAILYDYRRIQFFTAANDLSTYLQQYGIATVAFQGFSDGTLSIKPQLDAIEAADARIIYGIFGYKGARRMFCEAYMRGMKHPEYQFIILNEIGEDWFQDVTGPEFGNCTQEDYVRVAHGTFMLARSNTRKDKVMTVSHTTSENTWELIAERKRKVWNDHWTTRNPNATVDPIPDQQFYKNSMFAFDAVFVVALALDKVVKKHGEKGLIKKYQDEESAQLIADEMLNSDFEGATGHLSYDRKWEDERLGELILQQYQQQPLVSTTSQYSITLKFIDVATYYGTTNTLKFLQSKRELFKDKITRDRSFDNNRIYMTLSDPVLFTIWGIAVGGIIASIILLIINVRYRNIRLIKMSSPNINNGILAGSMICYTCMIVYGIDSKFASTTGIAMSCNSLTMLLSVGFSLTFGCLLSKTWRIYRIFTAAKTLERVSIKDGYLYGVVVLLLGIDLCVFVSWFLISPFYVVEEEEKESRSGHVITTYLFHKCKCDYQLHFTVALYSYKGLLLIIGLFLAWETRRVKVPVLNDSKYVGLSVYTVCVVTVVGAICSTALHSNHSFTTEYLVASLCIFTCTTGTLCFVFVPKLYMLFGKTDDKSKYRVNSMATTTIRHRSVRKFADDRTLSTDSQNSDLCVDKLPLKCRLSAVDTFTSSRCMRLDNQSHKGYVWNPPLPVNTV